MGNMFYENQEKKIPNNFKECYQEDTITKNLWLWCKRIEKWGKVLFWLLIVGGIILSIRTSIVEKEIVIEEATYLTNQEVELRKTFDFKIFISMLFNTALCAFLEYWIYRILALTIGIWASIVQNTKITANVALYRLDLENRLIKKSETSIISPKKDVWLCKECGQSNEKNTITCKGCGKYR